MCQEISIYFDLKSELMPSSRNEAIYLFYNTKTTDRCLSDIFILSLERCLTKIPPTLSLIDLSKTLICRYKSLWNLWALHRLSSDPKLHAPATSDEIRLDQEMWKMFLLWSSLQYFGLFLEPVAFMPEKPIQFVVIDAPQISCNHLKSWSSWRPWILSSFSFTIRNK
jgi:hypothetical protein